MNDRLITALGAVVALLLIVGMFVQTPEESLVTRPTSAEEGASGYLGMAEWLQASGIDVRSLRLRYDSLSGMEGLSGTTGHVLLTTPPYSKSARSDELRALMSWVAMGNSLIIAAALDDTPEWSELADTGGFMPNLEILTGTTFEAALDADGETIRVGEPGGEVNVYFLGESFSRHPLSDGVEQVVASTDGIASIWRPVDESPGEPFLQETSTGLAAGWTRAVGNGHVITLAAGGLFSNRSIGREDNGRLLSNLLHWHLAPEGTVLFDDLHHGLSEIYDPEAFYSDSRLGYTLLFVLAFWFAYMVGTSNRILPVRTTPAVPKQGDLVRSMGGFLARKLPANGAAGLLFERWFESLASRAGNADRASIWAYLSASPLVSADALGEVRRLHNDFEAGGRVDMSRLHNLILRITEALG